jgi:hypothetical protein
MVDLARWFELSVAGLVLMTGLWLWHLGLSNAGLFVTGCLLLLMTLVNCRRVIRVIQVPFSVPGNLLTSPNRGVE